ncbi:mitochondrial import receptor subunit TOM22 homolog [Drosophila tropicalis]|uniref:mitochondrial import receptor subunit TOM22 homolog n=1 Tax=Drosophila tropicalis TaxID=46794 RepID=UPI0035AB766A
MGEPEKAITDTDAEPDAEKYDDEPDESLGERVWGLSEMFPESVRNAADVITRNTVKGISTLYKFTCSASWIFFTTSVILFAPVIFETERAQMEELQKSQQKQVLLGPGSAVIPSGPAANLPLIR